MNYKGYHRKVNRRNSNFGYGYATRSSCFTCITLLRFLQYSRVFQVFCYLDSLQELIGSDIVRLESIQLKDGWDIDERITLIQLLSAGLSHRILEINGSLEGDSFGSKLSISYQPVDRITKGII